MTPRRIEKPWGFEVIWAETDRYVGKLLHINAGQELSLQRHARKNETLYVIRGPFGVTIVAENCVGEFQALAGGASVHVPAGTIHRFNAPTWGAVEAIEVSDFVDGEDIERLEDRYGRVG